MSRCRPSETHFYGEVKQCGNGAHVQVPKAWLRGRVLVALTGKLGKEEPPAPDAKAGGAS